MVKLLELLVQNVDQVQDSRLAAHEAEVAFQIVPQESQAKPAGWKSQMLNVWPIYLHFG